MSEILFVVEESDDAGWMAKAVGHSIVTEADSLKDLRAAVLEAVDCHFDNTHRSPLIRLRIIREEVLPV
jgi:hypothetical protein